MALAVGIVFSFWPLCAAALVVAAVSGQYFAAVSIGLVMDIVYGAPVGHWHWVYAPFTLLSCVMALSHFWLIGRLREGDTGRL